MEDKTICISGDNIKQFSKKECQSLCTKPNCRLTVVFETGVQYPQEELHLYDKLFSHVNSNVVAVIIKDKATMPPSAFANCKRLESVKAAREAIISDAAFERCTNLIYVHLDDCTCSSNSFRGAHIQNLHTTPRSIAALSKSSTFMYSYVNILTIQNDADDKNPAELLELVQSSFTHGFKGMGAILFCTPLSQKPPDGRLFSGWWPAADVKPIVCYAYNPKQVDPEQVDPYKTQYDWCDIVAVTEYYETQLVGAEMHEVEQFKHCPVKWFVTLDRLDGTPIYVTSSFVLDWVDAIKSACLSPEEFFLNDNGRYFEINKDWKTQCFDAISKYTPQYSLRAAANSQYPDLIGNWYLSIGEPLAKQFEDLDRCYDIDLQRMIAIWKAGWNGCFYFYWAISTVDAVTDIDSREALGGGTDLDEAPQAGAGAAGERPHKRQKGAERQKVAASSFADLS